MLSKRKIMDNPKPMVSSSMGVVNSLLDKLSKLEGYYSEFKDLTHGLESIRKDLLKFAARVKSMQFKQWMKQVREVFYDMEDWIDLIIHLAGGFQQDEPEPATDIVWSELAEKIEEFKAQILDAQDRCTRYGLLTKALTSDADLADLGPSKVTIDPNLLWGEKTGLVALKGPENELVKRLMDEEQKLKVVSILGMGGLGKTTLAKQVYGKLQWGFECRAFVYGGQNPSMKTTLINILYQVMSLPRYEVESWGEKDVISKLWEFLGKNSPETESTHNSKGNASLGASMIDDYPGTQDPNGTGTGLAIACDNGGPYYVVNDHTLNKNDWFCAPLNGCSPGPKLCQFISDRAAFGLLKRIEDLAAFAAATFTTEREKIGRPLWLAGCKHSPTARVSKAANPGGATVVFVLDSGASMHAVGEARIMQGIRLFSFGMWATLPNNSRLRIIGIGTVEMSGFSIPNVYLVEGLGKNLISVSQLDRDHGMCCSFHGGQCQVMLPDGTVVGGAILEDDGLYQLRFLEVPQPEE